MRTLNLQSDIETLLTQFARCIPEVLLEFDLTKVQATFTGVDGVFDLVLVEGDDVETVIGEIVLDENLEAHFEVFPAE